MDDLNSEPCCELIPKNIKHENKDRKQQILRKVADTIIAKTVNISLQFKNDTSPDTNKDHVFEYACEVVSLGLLFLNYRDAIKEGDGERIMLCWKYFLPIFKATNRQNYAIEAFITLANCKVLPPRQAHQLIWS